MRPFLPAHAATVNIDVSSHQRCGAGSVTVNIHNATPGALAEAIVVGFAVHKATTA